MLLVGIFVTSAQNDFVKEEQLLNVLKILVTAENQNDVLLRMMTNIMLIPLQELTIKSVNQNYSFEQLKFTQYFDQQIINTQLKNLASFELPLMCYFMLNEPNSKCTFLNYFIIDILSTDPMCRRIM